MFKWGCEGTAHDSGPELGRAAESEGKPGAGEKTMTHGLLRSTAEQFIRNSPSDPRGYLLRAGSETWAKQAAAGEADPNKAIQVAPQISTAYKRWARSYAGRAEMGKRRNTTNRRSIGIRTNFNRWLALSTS